ncbi:hypothetical protein HYC85_009445 [Camellia sinensis]|uniref:Major facilitator superfamily (MFS) profile domain-containing protein n=1 Tax=Camellia sinensis TaxID=4442 RepID=A0A7J7HGW5_CAMSI|nr:hypothetical protein HYC85_009445 [Camellia sinensis]
MALPALYHRHVSHDLISTAMFNYTDICLIPISYYILCSIPVYLRVLQLLFMPMLAPVIGEEKLLSTALFISFLSLLVDSIAWSVWVPYVVAAFTIFTVFATPCLRSIVSKQVGPNEQGIAQGSISGITSIANVISPLIFSPLTDLFLSKRAPFYFPGFSIMCAAFASMIAFIPSVLIRAAHPIPSNQVGYNNCRD